MRSFFIRFLTISAFISLSACASTTPKENYLDAGARQHIKTVDAVLIAKQDEIGADIKRNSTLTELAVLASTATVVPLLLDLGVSGIRSTNAHRMAKPIRKKLEDHDFAFDFKKQIKQSLDGTTLDGVDDFLIIRDEYPGMRGELIAQSEADAVLMVDMKYAFTANFESLYVHSLAMLFPNNAELEQFKETPDNDGLIEFTDNIYRNQYAVGISTKLKGATPEENAAIWAEMTEEQLVDVLDVAALMLADTMAKDIGIDDLESDLNLIPEGQPLNTKYDNFNRKFANTRSLGETLPTDDAAKPAEDPEIDPSEPTESEIKAKVVDVRPGS